ncbi:hypothetical protein [Anaeroselena agilis]|uniref:Uncharacterized protein n=1 Tax=Anaeroselena agilis TaxID=3063788 RepID=A0ABU3NWI7_9FIRM|nr:hypothetical protein [Selenomonadales bacterium 4137-cl]
MRFPNSRALTVLDPVESTNEMQEIVVTYPGPGATIQGEIWPLKVNASRGIMGVTDTSTHQLFTTGQVAQNQQVVDGAAAYLVQYVAEWGTHREAVLCPM